MSGVKAAFVGHEAPKHVTMLPVVSAAGKLLVMIFIIEGVRLMSKYCEAWPEAVFLMTASGGIDNDCWPSIMKTVVERAPKPSCLLVDGHKVHCNNLATIEHAAEKKVGMVQGVAHLTHKTQALDVGGFPAFNQKYDEIKTAAMMDGATPDPANSIAWAKKAWEAITIDGVIPGIKNAFKKIGVYPWNPDAFTDDDFEAAALHGKIVGDLRAAAGLPRSPEAIVTEAFGPPLPPSMIKSAIEQHSTLSTGSVLAHRRSAHVQNGGGPHPQGARSGREGGCRGCKEGQEGAEGRGECRQEGRARGEEGSEGGGSGERGGSAEGQEEGALGK